MEGNIQANIQHIGDCLHQYHTWGEKHIVNICSGQTNTIPWGVDTYIPMILLGSTVIIMTFVVFKSSY